MMRILCRVLALLVLAGGVIRPVVAEDGDGLPPEPAYKGEIRRAADGKLQVQAFAPAEVANAASLAATGDLPATMVVGVGEKVTSIGEAARLARDGEIIEIRPGEYRGQPAVWTQNNLVIRGRAASSEGGDEDTRRPVMIADGKSAEGKGIWVVRGGNVRIENIEFRGARVADYNGAGIRFERGHLAVHGCAFFDNEMGILTANRDDMTLAVSDSEFAAAPQHAGDLHHLLYVGAIGRFTLSGSRFERGYLGHLVKSRARENDVRYNFIVDGAQGRASYELEFPNGGTAYVIGNVIGKAATTDNGVLVAYGAEGARWSENALFLVHNTLLNDYHAGEFLRVWEEAFPGGVETWLINNLLIGYGQLNKPAFGRFEGNAKAGKRELLSYGGLPLRPGNGSPLRASVRVAGEARGVALQPDAEFRFPIGTQAVHPGSALVPGAFQ